MQKMKALAVGAVAGMVGAALMGSSYKLIAKTLHAKLPAGEDATEKVAAAVVSKVVGRALTGSKKQIGGKFVHLTFGATMGAIYGVLAETLPISTSGAGTLFGVALFIGAHAITVPTLGLAESPFGHSPVQEVPEFGAHIVYGLTLDAVRRLLTSCT